MVELVAAVLPTARMAPPNERQNAIDPGAFKSAGTSANVRYDKGRMPRIQGLPTRHIVPTPRQEPEPATGPPPAFPVNVLEAEAMHRRNGVSATPAAAGADTLPGTEPKSQPSTRHWAVPAPPENPAIDILR